VAGTLYVVATPIGNLQDITSRAVETLRSADFLICEDTRHSRILLDAYGIRKPTVSLFQGKEAARTESALARLAEGATGAFITDAGTPNVSDPGYRLVAECIRRGIALVTVPGPSALIAALAVSGLPTDAFVFEGFLPPRKAARVRKMKEWIGEGRTVIFYESPHRLAASLADLAEILGDVRIVLARELTKKFEEIVRAPVSSVLKRYEKERPKGEFVVLFNLRMQDPKGEKWPHD
jgi:16S rRNA (cytidine1402-2'-O)-methyltransferase